MAKRHCTLGLDYGTNSVRALIVDCATGEELGTHVWDYAHGDMGIVTDPKDPNLARQHPADYLEGLSESVRGALANAANRDGFDPDAVIGIGVDATGSTPLPVDAEGQALALQNPWRDNPNALAWLWKDHTSIGEAAQITSRARELRPHFLAKCGGTFSSEWYWAKLLHCAHVDPEVFEAAATWIELTDWLPAVLTGTTAPDQVARCVCCAGHKAMFNPSWGGYPDAAFLEKIDPRLAELRKTLPQHAANIAEAVGTLTGEWAEKLGLPAGVPVAAGALDAHLGAVGSGIEPGTLVKIIGTSTCDLAVAPLGDDIADIPGLCGIVPESVLPGAYGIEAGQSAVGDIFHWFVQKVQPGQPTLDHEQLNEAALALKPGESGLLALDWNNGNRTILVDQELTGLILGLSLHTTPTEIYRALIEATAFGARVILERLMEYGVEVNRVINCGGIALKSPLTMQIYADVLGCPMAISRSMQTCALGSAMAGAVVAGREAGGHEDFTTAARAMSGVLDTMYEPIAAHQAVYDRLFGLYQQLHDLFGTRDYAANPFDLMKDLLAIRQEARQGA